MLNRHILLQSNSRLVTSVAPTLSSVCRRSSTTTSTFQNEDDDDAPALSAISTATAISRTLRKYREATSSSSKNKNKNTTTMTMNMNNNNNDWVDLEKLLSSKYLSRMDMEEQSTSAPILRPLQISEEILAGSTAFKQAGLELKPQLLVRLCRPATAANVFVDTDGLLPSDLVDVFTSSSSIRMLPDHSTITCVRHATNTNPSVRNFGLKLCELAQLNPIRYSVGEDIICSTSSSSALRENSGNMTSMDASNDQSDNNNINNVEDNNNNNNSDETLYVSRHFNNNDTTGKSTGASNKFSSTSLLRSFQTSSNSTNSTNSTNRSATTTLTTTSTSASLVKNYMFVEKLAAQLHASHTVVLHDVIYVCSDENFALYRDHVSKATEFLDADVFVVSPNHYKKVYSKTVAPVVSPTVV